ncbi:PDZ domain-containing protein [Streptomyces sp. NPDC018029]|uniref:PDZ domain-containing protein n=1 Tax=Streptomyces sp. NPDC018029 TaxID=3365032 RepID=UPI00379B6813
MDQTTLRPKPMPGRHPGHSQGPAPGRRLGKLPRPGNPPGPPGPPGPSGPAKPARPGRGHRPHAARRRGKRLTTLLFGLLCAAVLVLTGIGLGTVGATVVGMSKLAEMRSETGQPAPGPAAPGAGAAPGADSARGSAAVRAKPSSPQEKARRSSAAHPRTATLGVEAVDALRGSGALLVGVHIPGPGHAAGLVRGDTLLAFGGTRIDSAAELAAAVGAARPGGLVTLTVRHAGGARQALSVRPGVVT